MQCKVIEESIGGQCNAMQSHSRVNRRSMQSQCAINRKSRHCQVSEVRLSSDSGKGGDERHPRSRRGSGSVIGKLPDTSRDTLSLVIAGWGMISIAFSLMSTT